MNRAHDKDVSDTVSPPEEPVGKVEFDGRGKAIWRWARDKIDSTSVLLKRLDNKNLALEPTQKVPVMGGKPQGASSGKSSVGAKHAPHAVEPDEKGGRSGGRDAFGRPRKRDGGGGFDPYNSR
jgi:hypothetical protein